VRFLSVHDVLAIHENTIRHEGGLAGLRDAGLLESAVLMPQQRFGGEYLHPGLAEMAAAYLFHICRNHAFIDGNKRVAVLAALIFLRANGLERLPDPEGLEAVTLAVASGEWGKAELTDWLRGEVGDHRVS
jgi:death-on-curing protein